MSESLVYLIETKQHILWSKRKIDTQYLHATEFLFRDRAKYREVNQRKFNQMKNYSKLKFIEIEPEGRV